jgi:hypothetical protein
MSSINQQMSLYIPYVFTNITQEEIAKTFERLDMGIIKRVDLIPHSQKNYNVGYVHFEIWYENPTTISFQKVIMDNQKQQRLVYDDPSYWIIMENKSPLSSDAEYKKEQSKIRTRICLDGERQFLFENQLIIPYGNVIDMKQVNIKQLNTIILNDLKKKYEQIWQPWFAGIRAPICLMTDEDNKRCEEYFGSEMYLKDIKFLHYCDNDTMTDLDYEICEDFLNNKYLSEIV